MIVQNVNPRLTLQAQKDLAEHYCRAFNKSFPVGALVWYWATPTLGPVYQTTTRSVAFVNVIGDRADACVMLDGVTGEVPVAYVKRPNEQRRDQIKPVSLDFAPAAMVVQAERLTAYAFDETKEWRNTFQPTFGDREHLKFAAAYLRKAAECLDAAHVALGEEK